ncbi:MAG: twin-arginine translocase subunit TatC [Pseudomonadota bacterium]
MSFDMGLREGRRGILGLLEDLRTALIRIGIAIGVFSVAAYAGSGFVLKYLVNLTGVRLAAYGIPETFLALVSLAAAMGVFISTPYILYSILAPLSRSFESFGRRQMFAFWIASMLLFYAGAVFCLKVTLPYGARFLLSFEDRQVMALISVHRFTSFCLLFIFGFGCIFELPLVMILVGGLGLVNVRMLSSCRRYAILAVAVISAVLTPTPDVVNMALMGVPLYLLYEIGLLGMCFWHPGRGQPIQTLRKAKTPI